MNTDNATFPLEHPSENDRRKRALQLWWRSWFAPELAVFRGPWLWFAWSVTALGLLGAPLLFASGRTDLAVGIGVISATFALEAMAVQIAARRQRLARALHIVSIVAMFGLVAILLWRNPLDWGGSRWQTFAIIFGLSVLRSVWDAWRSTAPDRNVRTTA